MQIETEKYTDKGTMVIQKIKEKIKSVKHIKALIQYIKKWWVTVKVVLRGKLIESACVKKLERK